MSDIDDNTPFSIVYEKVLAGKDHLSVTRLLAASLVSEPYMTVQHFLLGLNDKDLDTLIDLSEKDQDPQFGDLVLIAGMLAEAEGLGSGNMDEYQKRVSGLVGFLVIESLARKGLVKAYRENMSFGDDMNDKVIVELIRD